MSHQDLRSPNTAGARYLNACIFLLSRSKRHQSRAAHWKQLRHVEAPCDPRLLSRPACTLPPGNGTPEHARPRGTALLRGSCGARGARASLSPRQDNPGRPHVLSAHSQCPPEPRGLLPHTPCKKGRVSSLWNRRPRCKVEKHRRQRSSNSSSETALGWEAQAARMAVVLRARSREQAHHMHEDHHPP